MVERKKGVLQWGRRGGDGSGWRREGRIEKIGDGCMKEVRERENFCTRTGMKFQLDR